MKRILLLFLLIGSFVYSQNLCEECVEQNGFYCGDDPANWTQYSPNGCVPNGFNGLNYLNDGWEDCVSGADEQNAVPTTLADCGSYVTDCDTVYVEIPIIQYEYIFDTIVEYETIIELDTIVEYETIVEYDTIIEIQYEEILEYIDCDTGLPCNTGMNEILDKSNATGLMYNLLGQPIRKPEGIYIENGKIKYIQN